MTIAATQAEILREIKRAKRTKLEDRLAFNLRAAGIQFKRQFQFAPPRRWRADFAIKGTMILVEIDGEGHQENGKWIPGGHLRSKGMRRDIEKQNAAVLMGYRPLRFTAAMIRSGKALSTIEGLIETERYYGGR
jgi:very-short-patch-repair endonuclease